MKLIKWSKKYNTIWNEKRFIYILIALFYSKFTKDWPTWLFLFKSAMRGITISKPLVSVSWESFLGSSTENNSNLVRDALIYDNPCDYSNMKHIFKDENRENLIKTKFCRKI